MTEVRLPAGPTRRVYVLPGELAKPDGAPIVVTDVATGAFRAGRGVEIEGPSRLAWDRAAAHSWAYLETESAVVVRS